MLTKLNLTKQKPGLGMVLPSGRKWIWPILQLPGPAQGFLIFLHATYIWVRYKFCIRLD